MDLEPARAPATGLPAPSRRLLAVEVLLVLGVSLGRSASDALIGFVARNTAPTGDGQPHGAVIYASEAPGTTAGGGSPRSSWRTR